MIDVATPTGSNIRKKEHEKIEKYQGLKKQLGHMWKNLVVLLVIELPDLR